MITLKIKKPGHTIEIPGLPTFRSPVDVDITKLDMRKVAMYLKAAGIRQYEIVSESDKSEKKIYTLKDFEKVKPQKNDKLQLDINKRFNKLENLMTALLTREAGNIDLNKEQINDKLDKLEKLVSQKLNSSTQYVYKKIKPDENEPEIEELDSFIPEIDVSNMKIKSDIKTIKRDDDDLEDAADILSGLIKK